MGYNHFTDNYSGYSERSPSNRLSPIVAELYGRVTQRKTDLESSLSTHEEAVKDLQLKTNSHNKQIQDIQEITTKLKKVEDILFTYLANQTFDEDTINSLLMLSQCLGVNIDNIFDDGKPNYEVNKRVDINTFDQQREGGKKNG